MWLLHKIPDETKILLLKMLEMTDVVYIGAMATHFSNILTVSLEPQVLT